MSKSSVKKTEDQRPLKKWPVYLREYLNSGNKTNTTKHWRLLMNNSVRIIFHRRICKFAVTSFLSMKTNWKSSFKTRLLEHGFDASIETGAWDKAVIYGLNAVPPYELYYGKDHPYLGLHLMKLGKIMLQINHPNARSIITVSKPSITPK